MHHAAAGAGHAALRIVLQQAAVVLGKVQCQVLT